MYVWSILGTSATLHNNVSNVDFSLSSGITSYWVKFWRQKLLRTLKNVPGPRLVDILSLHSSCGLPLLRGKLAFEYYEFETAWVNLWIVFINSCPASDLWWRSEDVRGRPCVLFWAILHSRLEHLWVWAFTGGPGTNPPPRFWGRTVVKFSRTQKFYVGFWLGGVSTPTCHVSRVNCRWGQDLA